MFLGEYEHTLDEKNRLTLPAKFRESFSGGGVVTRGMDGCLYVYAADRWNELAEGRLGSLDLLKRDDRVIQRYFFASAADVELDKQGRMMVPAALVRAARLDRDVVVAGVYDHLEIWDRVAWREQLQTVEGSAEHVAERLATRHD
jgi:MraZ protein